MKAISAVKIELHKKLKGEEPCHEGMELEQVLLHNLVDLLVSGRGIGRWSAETVLKGRQFVQVEAKTCELVGETIVPTSLVSLNKIKPWRRRELTMVLESGHRMKSQNL